jgi:hypothetical protein
MQSMKIQAYRCTWDGDTRQWMQYHDHTDPLPHEWDDEPPDEVAALVLKIDADIEIEHLQARIDALMLEHCPDEMTPEQVANWERHQKAVY